MRINGGVNISQQKLHCFITFFLPSEPMFRSLFPFFMTLEKSMYFFFHVIVLSWNEILSLQSVSKSILTTTTARSEDIKISFTPAGKYTRCFQTFPNKFNHLIFVNTYKFMKENHFPCIPRGTTSKNLTINCHNKMVILCWMVYLPVWKAEGFVRQCIFRMWRTQTFVFNLKISTVNFWSRALWANGCFYYFDISC